mmetsp:Transcript_9673/g.27251  ORF Transcript_9673/g.27251 Transcript_9673/m.27251 type:complete len:228 (+) Transcript_9673:185-868(+)
MISSSSILAVGGAALVLLVISAGRGAGGRFGGATCLGTAFGACTGGGPAGGCACAIFGATFRGPVAASCLGGRMGLATDCSGGASSSSGCSASMEAASCGGGTACGSLGAITRLLTAEAAEAEGSSTPGCRVPGLARAGLPLAGLAAAGSAVFPPWLRTFGATTEAATLAGACRGAAGGAPRCCPNCPDSHTTSRHLMPGSCGIGSDFFQVAMAPSWALARRAASSM